MSVREYTAAETGQLYGDIVGLKSSMLLFEENRRVREVLRAAFVANKAALAMTYGAAIAVDVVNVPDGANANVDPAKVYDAIGLLQYNCVSNGGRDFLPAQDRAVLDGIRESIARHFIERAQAKRTRGRAVRVRHEEATVAT